MKRFYGRGVDGEDLFQQGVVGLLQAKNTYDVTRGTRFSTWAVPIILGCMRAACDKAPAAHVPRTDREKWRLMMGARASLASSLGREPTAGELLGALHITPGEFVQVLSAGQLRAEPMDENSPHLLQPCFEDELLLRETICHLPDPLPKLIRLRHQGRLDQRQTARVLGVSQSCVSKLEKKAAQRLKEMLVQG